MPGSFIQAV